MIDSMTLSNMKAFKFLNLPLARLTLLSGINAVGKSTILQALAMLRQSYEAGLLTSGGGLLLHGGLAELGIAADVLHEDFTADAQGRPFVKVGLQIEETSYSWSGVIESSDDRRADVLPLVELPTTPRISLFSDEFQYLRADRIVPAVTYPKSYEMTVRRQFLGSRGEHTVNFLRVHRDSEVAPTLRHSQSASSSLLDQVEAWLQDLCPGVNIDAVDLTGTDMVQLSYGFFGRAGLAAPLIRYRPTNVGFGLTYALPIVVACLSCTPGSLILLENPEAHLHPRGQAALARLIAHAAEQGAQIIVETHSDHVLNGIRLAVKAGSLDYRAVALHYFSRPTAVSRDQPVPEIRVDSPTVGSDGMLSAWPSGFFDEWDVAVDRLLDE